MVKMLYDKHGKYNGMKRVDENFHLTILEDFSKLITESKNFNEIIDNMVDLIARRLKMDACSLFLHDPETKKLVLRATKGFKPESVGQVIFNTNEGLTGLAFEKKMPITVNDPQSHPRYKYFPITGEEIYNSFLGVPIIVARDCIGVITVHTKHTYYFHPNEINMLKALAAQVASLMQVASLIKDNEKPLIEENEVSTKESINTLKGIPTSPGFGIGKIIVFDEKISSSIIPTHKITDVSKEVEQLEIAIENSKEELENIKKDLKIQLTSDVSTIFDAHIMLLEDENFKSKIVDLIETGKNAAYAVFKLIEDYTHKFEKLENAFFRDRIYDIEDIGKRVIGHILGICYTHHKTSGPAILAAKFLTPSTTATIDTNMIKGIITEHGGATSHASILARSLEIPAVVGVKNLMDKIHSSQTALVDGDTGFVFVNPSEKIINEYEIANERLREYSKVIFTAAKMPSITKDNVPIKVSTNVGLFIDIDIAKKHGVNDVGLFRTEFLYMLFNKTPTIEEQLNSYKQIITSFEGGTITIRTLDVGGDKPLPYIAFPLEENPYLGFRSIRFSLNSLSMFKDQIKAILLASKYGNVQILLPMITTVREIQEARGIVDKCRMELEADGHQDIPKDIPLGIMVEVPSVLFQLDGFMNHCDFFSIGTNDLVQYLLAVDRNNEKVSNMYNPLHPSVLEAIKLIYEKCEKYNKPISVCGEMAGNPRSALALLSIGIKELSVNPSSIPRIKYLINRVDKGLMNEIKEKIFAIPDEKEIEAILLDYINMIAPELNIERFK